MEGILLWTHPNGRGRSFNCCSVDNAWCLRIELHTLSHVSSTHYNLDYKAGVVNYTGHWKKVLLSPITEQTSLSRTIVLARLGKRTLQETVSHTFMRWAWMVSLFKETGQLAASKVASGSAFDKMEFGNLGLSSSIHVAFTHLSSFLYVSQAISSYSCHNGYLLTMFSEWIPSPGFN